MTVDTRIAKTPMAVINSTRVKPFGNWKEEGKKYEKEDCLIE